LNKLRKKYLRNSEIEFIAITLDSEYKLDSFLYRYPFSNAIIPDGRFFATKFETPFYPTNIVIYKNGVIQYYNAGGIKSADIGLMAQKTDRSLERLSTVIR
tara:strand:+ start:12508 stop:12810 length:303 start_codon:yes stop_codon:yes gene_type:complete